MRVAFLLPFWCVVSGCGGGSTEIAAKNRTFYDWPSASQSETGDANAYEQAYPKLDLASAVEYLGKTVVRGGVHLSRPKDWRIREASNEPGRAFIQYISPHAYSFAVYERSDSPDDLWRDVMSRYQRDVSSVGAKVTGEGVPVGVWLGQGRAFSVERDVASGKHPFVGFSRELLLRGEHRFVLVQIVRQRADFSSIDRELLRVVETLEVL